MNQVCPCRGWNEVGRCGWAGDGEEAGSPGLKVVEVEGWGSGHYAVEIVGKHFGGFDALTSAEGASEEVGFPIWLIVEEVGEFLSGLGDGVKPFSWSILLACRTEMQGPGCPGGATSSE